MTHLLLSDNEFGAIERLLADLIETAVDAEEEAKILAIHARVEAIYAQGDALRRSRVRLARLRTKEKSDG